MQICTATYRLFIEFITTIITLGNLITSRLVKQITFWLPVR